VAGTHDISTAGQRAALRQAAAFGPRVLANSGGGCALLGREIHEPLLAAEQFHELPLGTASTVNQYEGPQREETAKRTQVTAAHVTATPALHCEAEMAGELLTQRGFPSRSTG